MSEATVLDLFAGAGGVSLGLALLGIEDLGVELADEECATRNAAGFLTMQADVSQLEVSCEHNLIREAAVWVRLQREPRTAWLIGCELLTGPVDVPVELDLDATLADLVFDLLEPAGGYGPRHRTPATADGYTRAAAKAALERRIAERLNLSASDARDEARRLWDLSGLQEYRSITAAQWDRLVARIGIPPSPEEDPDATDGADTAPPADPDGEVEPPSTVPSPSEPTEEQAA